DLRFEATKNKHLIGWTLLIEKKEEIKEPVETTAQAEEIDKQDKFKIDYKTGEPKEQKIQVIQKGTQPLVWLDLKGVTKPGTVGATKEFPGVFHAIDKGLYEQGADKPFFKEYFMKGKIFNGRYIFRKLPASRNLRDTGKVPFVWFFWKPIGQNPYILSTRAIRKQDFPVDTSWLPSEWEKRIPDDLKWWGKDLTQKEATELIKENRKNLLQKELLTEELERKDFVLLRHWWQGQKVVRDLPVEHWDIIFKGGYGYTLDKNPILDPEDINGVYFKKPEFSEDPFKIVDITIPPGKPGNPNKEIDANVERLETGTVEIIEHTENFLSVEFKGKQLKGFFTFRKTGPSGNKWVMAKGKQPQAMTISLAEVEIQHIIDLSDPQLQNSRNDIARQIPCSPSAVYKWQKKAKLI
ncbi:hypothetical protein LCGC14_2276260, partial [marine sediment metagenome]